MTEKTTPRPTNVRATVSEEEWNQFRALAAITRQSSTELLGTVIRTALQTYRKETQ